jgi:RHS repeat-associated protein
VAKPHPAFNFIAYYATTESGEMRYLPWGKGRFTSGQTLTSYKFTGQREEAGLGLYYYGARWYDPSLGRFIQPDTLVPNPGDAAAFDRYAYVLNNPLKYRDPTGHCSTSGSGATQDRAAYKEFTECWKNVDTILQQWNTTPQYWNGRYTSAEVFLKYVAPTPSLDSTYFQDEIMRWLKSDDYNTYRSQMDKVIAQNRVPTIASDSVDAVGVGVSYNADIPILGAAGLAGSGGVEVLAHKNGQVAVYLFGGGGASVGAGANTSLYVVRVRNLKDAEGYAGPSISSDVTASLLVGLTAGTFEGPNGGAYGEKYGFAPGANLSGSVVQSSYSPPWIIFDSRPR